MDRTRYIFSIAGEIVSLHIKPLLNNTSKRWTSIPADLACVEPRNYSRLRVIKSQVVLLRVCLPLDRILSSPNEISMLRGRP